MTTGNDELKAFLKKQGIQPAQIREDHISEIRRQVSRIPRDQRTSEKVTEIAFKVIKPKGIYREGGLDTSDLRSLDQQIQNLFKD